MGEVTTSAFAGGKTSTASRPAGRGDQLSDGLTDPLARARTPIQAPAVQADGGAVAASNPQGVAASGTSGGGGPLPHHDRIQSSFGHHDVSDVTAHTDASAVAANSAFGSHGFAFGKHVGLATNDLHTVAHEAAHTVQQSEGVHLVDGVGTSGDTYEQHADKVADAVVAGRSAEALLDATPRGTGGKGLQLDLDEQALPDDLKGPDRVELADTPVYRTNNGSNELTRIGPTRGIRLKERSEFALRGRDPIIRHKVVWFEWRTEDKGFKEITGWVDESALNMGSEYQTQVESARILPADASGIKHQDVYQHGLSDCYFQAAMAGVANAAPQTIFDAITVQGDSVVVTFWLSNRNLPQIANDGLVQQRITVARSLLLDAKGQPVYGGKLKPDSFVWPAFMSKAWAVVKGSYSESAMGSASEALRAITGEGHGAALAVAKTAPEAWTAFSTIRDALEAGKPVLLGTGNFAKEGKKARAKNWSPFNSGPTDQPQGKVTNLHTYAVIKMTNMDYIEDDFNDGQYPDITLTLRNPRDAKGDTFERKLKDILTAGKFEQIHTG